MGFLMFQDLEGTLLSHGSTSRLLCVHIEAHTNISYVAFTQMLVYTHHSALGFVFDQKQRLPCAPKAAK